MNLPCSGRKALVICAAVLMGVSFSSWKEGTPVVNATLQDTTPLNHDKKIVDLDEALHELDGAKADLEKNLRDIDWNKIDADVKSALKDVDVNLQNANAELKKSLQKIDVDKLRQNVEASVARIDWDAMKRELEQVKNIDMGKVKTELENVKTELMNLKPELEKNLSAARESIERSKAELQSYKSFVANLERDGLIEKDKGSVIEHKDGQLLLNGKVQPAEVYNKYRAFLEAHKTFTLKKDGDEFKLENK